MGREVRRVPSDWAHPRRPDGGYIPLYGGSYKIAVEDAKKYEEDLPDYDDYMPDWRDEERTHYQMYEDTSEGTPISPVLESPEVLARWLVDNEASAFAGQTASYESWLRVANGGFAPSMIITPATGLVNGVDGIKPTTPASPPPEDP